MKTPIYILINPFSHQGLGMKRWKSIRPYVLDELAGASEIVIEKEMALQTIIPSLRNKEETCIISAGGDGSMHHLCNELLKDPSLDLTKIRIGAIGLGSSNDFLKPFQRTINKIPVRIELNKPAYWQDAGKVFYTSEDGRERMKYFIVNASFGATAKGNWNFNHPGPLLKWLKKTNTSLAISYTSIATILGSRNDECLVSYQDEEKQMKVTNINILKIPYVAGSLYYDQALSPDDNRLGLHICSDMNKLELIKTLVGLGKGKFEASNHRTSGYTTRFSLSSSRPVVFECDGETEKASSVRIELIPKALQFLK